MPYIKVDDRIELNTLMRDPETAGELNYAITKMVMFYLNEKKKNYQTMNDIIGALEGAKTEFYRRVVAPYEDQKISENGDVY